MYVKYVRYFLSFFLAQIQSNANHPYRDRYRASRHISEKVPHQHLCEPSVNNPPPPAVSAAGRPPSSAVFPSAPGCRTTSSWASSRPWQLSDSRPTSQRSTTPCCVRGPGGRGMGRGDTGDEREPGRLVGRWGMFLQFSGGRGGCLCHVPKRRLTVDLHGGTQVVR